MNVKRILSLLLCVLMIVTCTLPIIACSDDPDVTCTHIDEDEDGKCDSCGETLTIICEEHVDSNSDGECDNCGAEVKKDDDVVVPAGKTDYTVRVTTVGGMPLYGISVYVYNSDDNIVALPKSTNEKGIATFSLETKSDYTVYLDGVPKGYNVKTGESAEDRYPMGASGTQIILSSKPVTEGSLESNYNLGDVMYDFSIADVNGNTHKLSDILKTKKMVMLNFWYVGCSWCNKEFPGLNDAYQNYTDKLEVLAINDYADDTLADVKAFPTTGSYENDNLVMPLCKVTSQSSLTIDKFGGFAAGQTGYPTTIIIDRYGVICMIEQGAIVGEAKWNKIFDYFTSDNYTQKLIENSEDLTPPEVPDVPWAGSDAIAENLSGNIIAEYEPEDDEYSWNFIPDEVEGVKVVKPSNTSDNSYGILYANIQLKPGQAVMFDYFASCEYSNDRLVVIVDGNDICSLTGINKGNIANLSDWEQCCAFVDPRPITSDNKDEIVTYALAFAYIKDTEISEGDDTVYLRNLRTISVNEIEIETYIVRDAVSNPTNDNSGFHSYVDYMLGADGYYHVVDADGNEGPLLLANLLGYTNFDSYKIVSQRIMDAGEILVDGVDMYNYWMVFANASANATMYGYTPVTPQMKDILNAYCNFYRNEVGKDAHEDIWLQLCTYYDAYGKDADGNPTKHVENPIKGLTTFSAYETDFKENPAIGDTETFEVTYDRVVMPRGFLYRFSPRTSGVYRITSRSTDEMIGWIFTGSSIDWVSSEDGERIVLSDFEEEERYCPALIIDNGDGTYTKDINNVSLMAYMEAGKDYYIDIAYDDLYAVGTFTFDITYEGSEFDVFVMASPGPVTYIENASGGMGQLIAIGIDYDFKDENGTLYAYQVLERDDDGNPTVWGNKIYADFYYPTIPFPSQSIEELAKIDAFNFAISEYDRDAMILLEEIRKDGKNAIITKWTNDKTYSDPSATWTEKNIDAIMVLLQQGADVSDYNAEDVAIASDALEIGVLALKKEWGIDAIGSSSDWTDYYMDEALAGILSDDENIRATQETVLANIEKRWTTIYQMDDVAKGIYHGTGVDETDAIMAYINAMDDGSEAIERQGCVAVTKELSILLSQLYSKFNFDNVLHDWLKFCFYYKHLGA